MLMNKTKTIFTFSLFSPSTFLIHTIQSSILKIVSLMNVAYPLSYRYINIFYSITKILDLHRNKILETCEKSEVETGEYTGIIYTLL